MADDKSCTHTLSNQVSYKGPCLLWLMDLSKNYHDAKCFKTPQTFSTSDTFKFSSGCTSFQVSTSDTSGFDNDLMVENIEFVHCAEDQDVYVRFTIFEDNLISLDDWDSDLFQFNYFHLEVLMQSSHNDYVQIQNIVCKPVWPSVVKCSCGKTIFHISGKLCCFTEIGKFIQQQSYLEIVSDSLGSNMDGPIPHYQYLLDLILTVTFSMNKKAMTEDKIQALCFENLKDVGKKVLTQALHTDFTLKADGMSFPCHKSTLSGGSEVLAAMLESDFSEGQSQEWIVDDMSSRGAQSFLNFLYFGDLEDPKSDMAIAFELLRAGHKYMIQSMEEVSEQILTTAKSDVFDPTTAFELFAFCGNANGLQLLQKKAANYFRRNAAEFASSGELAKLISENPQVAAKLFVMVVDGCIF